MKTILYLSLICIFILSCYNEKRPLPGDWKGKSISFSVDENGESIIKLEVVIPHGDEFIVQWYEDLKIEDNKFSSYQDGNSYLGIPKRDIKGEFVSNKLAKGTFNDIKWEAKPE